MSMVRAHVFFAGTVQGVGFRFTTQRNAEKLHLKGWVKNCPDGRVEADIVGPREDIEALLTCLHVHFGACLHSKTIEWLTATDNYSDFRIVH